MLKGSTVGCLERGARVSLGSDESLERDFCARFSDIISRENERGVANVGLRKSWYLFFVPVNWDQKFIVSFSSLLFTKKKQKREKMFGEINRNLSYSKSYTNVYFNNYHFISPYIIRQQEKKETSHFF